MVNAATEVTVIGSGSWATAIVKLLTPNCSRIGWFIREAEIIEHIGEHKNNPTYLSSVDLLPEKLVLTGDINEAVSMSDILIFVVPSAFLKATLRELTADISGKTVCSAIKGIVPEDNMIVGEFLNKAYRVPYNNLVILSGPTHAEEIALEKLTYLTVAGLEEERANHVASLLNNYFLRTILSDDIFGTEYAAVLKNIYAIGAGICHGLGYGDNFLAVFLSNAASEMKGILDQVYVNHREITSSAYLGDLLVTGYSQFSRNRMFGNMIGKGTSVRFALIEMTMVAEGYYASECINELNKGIGAEMPIADTIYRILYQNAKPAREIEKMTNILK